ncbi:uncharacterized protein LOC110773709 [Prunus avium]|uniref:Uncharacterized protein LOC110773709 n=1 Tax=Prunus avium TaxID=42229 RepID=A0A6P5U408_PRUAV|nr:uncharacterized protein LOC110773709 [Prunus avium]
MPSNGLLIIFSQEANLSRCCMLSTHRLLKEPTAKVVVLKPKACFFRTVPFAPKRIAIKMYNAHASKHSRKSAIWKTLQGTPKQPTNVECSYYVMRFMRDIIRDPTLEFEKKFEKKK